MQADTHLKNDFKQLSAVIWNKVEKMCLVWILVRVVESTNRAWSHFLLHGNTLSLSLSLSLFTHSPTVSFGRE